MIYEFSMQTVCVCTLYTHLWYLSSADFFVQLFHFRIGAIAELLHAAEYVFCH